MFYDEEELLEAVDILMEDYDLTEEEAMEVLMENYEDDFDDYELDELSEAVDILMEDYDLTEDEAIDILLDEGIKDLKSRYDSLPDEDKKVVRQAGIAFGADAAIGGALLYKKARDRKRKNASTIDKIKYRTKKARKRRLRKARVKKVKKALHLK